MIVVRSRRLVVLAGALAPLLVATTSPIAAAQTAASPSALPGPAPVPQAGAPAPAAPAAWTLDTTSFAAPAGCPDLARRQTLYRVCDDQRRLFNDAVAAARRDGKLLLVTFGSTWCPTCKSFSGMLEQAGTAAKPSGAVAASDFAHVEIAISTLLDGRRVPVRSGEAVLARVLEAAPTVKLRSVPFIAVIDPHDMTRAFARNLDDCETTAGGTIDGERMRQILVDADAHVRQGLAAPSEPGWLRRKLKRWFAI